MLSPVNQSRVGKTDGLASWVAFLLSGSGTRPKPSKGSSIPVGVPIPSLRATSWTAAVP